MNDIKSDLKAYLDKELSPERMEEVRLAIEQDPALKEEAEFYQLLSRSIFSAAKTPEVSGMDNAVTKTLKATEKKKFSFPSFKALPSWGIPVASAAAVCALAMVIFGPAMNRGGLNPTSAPPADMAVAGASAEMERSMPADMESAPMSKAPASEPPGRFRGVEDKRAEVASKAPAFATAPVESTAIPSQRLITRSGDMTLRVKNISESAAKVERIAQRFGGFVESSNVSSDPKNPTAYFTIRVSSKQWVQANEALKGMGILISESATGSDVTAEVFDLEARVKTLKAEEDSLRTLLSRASRIGDILQIKDRLAQVRMEIESMAGQAKNLRNMAALSTITVNLTQEPKIDDETNPDPWMGDAWTSAVNAFQSAFKTVVGFCAYVIVFAPFWLPVLVISWIMVRKANKS
jgi:hypothetical protein